MDHLSAPSVLEAQRAFYDHLEACPNCQAASNTRNACTDGQRLHEAMVLAAHDAYRETQR